MPEPSDRRLVNSFDDASAQSSTSADARDQLLGQLGQPTANRATPQQVVPSGGEHLRDDAGKIWRHNEFVDRLRRFTPRVFVTRTMIALNLAAFVFMVLMGADIMTPSTQILIDLGANFSPLTTSGQMWRLVTCMFLHVGVIHLAFNLWALNVIGPLVERLLGNAAFLATYMFAGLVGSVASVIWNSGAVSAGASGAVFGLFGALVAVLWRRRKEMPLEIVTSLREQMLSIIGINIFLGFAIENIDSSAHLGGLVGGALAALLLSSPIVHNGQRERRRRLLLVAPVLGLLSLGVVYAMPRNVPDLPVEITQLETLHKRTDIRIDAAVFQYHQRSITQQQLFEILDDPGITELVKSRKRFETLSHIPSKYRGLHQTYVKVFRLRDNAKQLYLDAIRTDDLRERGRLQNAQRKVLADIEQILTAQ